MLTLLMQMKDVGRPFFMAPEVPGERFAAVEAAFLAVMKDPADPTRIRPEWMHDCYHPNALGDQQMAAAVNLSIFGLREP